MEGALPIRREGLTTGLQGLLDSRNGVHDPQPCPNPRPAEKGCADRR